MKRTQVIELFSNIKATAVSFFSIVMFVALSVGIFVGISWSGPALHVAADSLFEEGSFHDLHVQFPYGLTEADLEQLATVEGVSSVDAARSTFQTFRDVDGEKLTAKVQSLTTSIDVPLVVEGSLPDKAGEVALESAWAYKMGYAVGDTITLQHDVDESALAATAEEAARNADGMKLLTGDTYQVTALITSAAYAATTTAAYGLSNVGSGSIDCLLFVDLASFDAEAYHDGFTDVFVRSDALRNASTFDARYAQAADDLQAHVVSLGDVLANDRYNDLHQTVQTAVEQGESQLEAAAGRIAEGEAAIAQGLQQMASAEEQIAAGEVRLADAVALLQEKEAAYESGIGQLGPVRAQIDEAQARIDSLDGAVLQARSELGSAQAFKSGLDAKLAAEEITEEEYAQQLDDYCRLLEQKARDWCEAANQELPFDLSMLDHDTFDLFIGAVDSVLGNVEDTTIEYAGQTLTVREAREKLSSAKSQLADAEQRLASARRQLNDGWVEYHAGTQQLEDARAQVTAGKDEIVARQQQLDEGKAAYAEGETKLELAKDQLAALQEYSWTVLTRTHNGGVQTVSSMSNITDNLRFSMAALFVIVGLLVCYSAVSRLVHEQMVQVGTKKALGLRNREVTLSFLTYSGLAVVSGAVIGAVAGVYLVENIIIYVLSEHFVMGVYPPYFSLPQFLLVGGLECALVLLATWFACHGVLKKNALALLQGAEPPSAKPHFFEAWAVWRKLPLLTQTMVNNCLNDGRRVAGTVIGVAGCTALIVTAIALNDNILTSFDRQYTDVYGFNAVAYLDGEVEGAQANVEAALQECDVRSVAVSRCVFSMTQRNGELSIASVTVPENEEQFQQLFHVTTNQGSAALGEAGVWVSAAYAEHQGARVGDEVVLSESDGKKHSFTIAGFFPFYLSGNQVVMSRSLYEASFATELAPNALLVDTRGASVEQVRERVQSAEGLATLVDDRATSKRTFDDFSKLSHTVVAIYLVLSTLMAIVVLLNLNVMCIEEKKRELIVLMINGFSVSDAKRYIYRDTIVLTALGILAGIVLGSVMGYFTVLSAESASSSFVKDVDAIACLVGALGSAVLAIAMSLVALRRIPRFELTDINRF